MLIRLKYPGGFCDTSMTEIEASSIAPHLRSGCAFVVLSERPIGQQSLNGIIEAAPMAAAPVTRQRPRYVGDDVTDLGVLLNALRKSSVPLSTGDLSESTGIPGSVIRRLLHAAAQAKGSVVEKGVGRATKYSMGMDCIKTVSGAITDPETV